MMHPKLGVEYTVESPITAAGLEGDSVVPIGEDADGNLRVDHWEDGDHVTRLWTEDEFQTAVRNDTLKEVTA